MKKSLYVHRPLLETKAFILWAKKNGFENILDADDLHVTLAFSRNEVNWNDFNPEKNKIKISGGSRHVTPLGNEGAIVLKFESILLQKRWKQFIDGGCSWDHKNYQPHISITYKDTDININNIEPYDGQLIFGPEVFKELDLNWKDKVKK